MWAARPAARGPKPQEWQCWIVIFMGPGNRPADAELRGPAAKRRWPRPWANDRQIPIVRRRVSAPSPRPATTWRALLGALLLFVLGDVVVFRSGLYAWLAKPDSAAGWVVRRTLLAPDPASDAVASVLLLGDSRIGEACDEHRLREQLGAPPVAVVQGSIPGSSPRVWPDAFARMPVPPGGWQLVVVGLAEFDDDADGERMSERLYDLGFFGPWLQPARARELATALDVPNNPNAVRDIWLCTFCKAFAWRRDFQDLGADPWTRAREVMRQLGRRIWGGPYDGIDRSLAGVRVENGAIVGPVGDERQDRVVLRHLVFREHCVDNAAYRRRWLGELVDRVTATGAQVVFVRLPSQVLPRAKPRVPNMRVLDELAQRPGVHVLPFELFAALEAPEYFFDALHVNRAGRRLLTPQLAEVLRTLFARELRRPQ